MNFGIGVFGLDTFAGSIIGSFFLWNDVEAFPGNYININPKVSNYNDIAKASGQCIDIPVNQSIYTDIPKVDSVYNG